VCSLRSTRAPRTPHSRTFPQWTQRPCRLSSCAVHCTGLFDKVARTTPTRARRSSPITPRSRRARGSGWRCFGRPAVHARPGAHRAADAAARRGRAGGAGGGREDAETRRQPTRWAAAVGRVGRVSSRRRRTADIFSSDLCVRASSWGRRPIRRVYSRASFCASTWQYVSMSVGSV
jgi:hypothetical protein